MSQSERHYKIHHLLALGKCLGKQRLLDELGVSPATLQRDLAHLRDRMNMPVVFDRARGGWRLDQSRRGAGTQYEIPNLWLSAEEIHALLTMQRRHEGASANSLNHSLSIDAMTSTGLCW